MNFMPMRQLTAALFCTFLPHTVAAQESGAFSLELNKTEASATGCILTYVAQNNTGLQIENASYEVVVFDTDFVVAQFLVLDFGALRRGRTKVVQFEIEEPSCSQISRILINTVAQCRGIDGDNSVCMDALDPTSRSDIKFGL